MLRVWRRGRQGRLPGLGMGRVRVAVGVGLRGRVGRGCLLVSYAASIKDWELGIP
jgi:hypothetical protein